jgi:microcystin degradation protein MlrC
MLHRVGVVGFEHEANALADVVGRERAVDLSVREGGLSATWEAGPLIRRLREQTELELVELPVWTLGACGPLDDDAFAEILRELDARIATALTAGPLEAVIVLGHGASRTVTDLDPDSTFVRAVRARLGEDVPVTWVLDFHANVSAEMCRLADVIVGYRTNPHVDIEDRLLEAADHTIRLLEGQRTCRAWCSTPLVLPQIALLTTTGEPLAEVLEIAASHVDGPVWNVSVFGGFGLADVSECGVSVVVTAARGHEQLALRVAAELADRAVEIRARYRTTLTPLDVAADIALASSRHQCHPVLLADAADNPGGGAPATSTAVLAALTSAGVTDAIVGVHCDPRAVEAAWNAGVGASIDLVLNSSESNPYATRFDGTVVVLALAEGPVVARRGVYAGAAIEPGRCCAVAFGGISLAISSRPVQCADESLFLHLGLDPAAARVVVVKSRGHFRAGFDHLFTPEQVVEVSAPGVATNDLASVEWSHLPRPSFPLDDIDHWQPVAVHCAGGAR